MSAVQFEKVGNHKKSLKSDDFVMHFHYPKLEKKVGNPTIVGTLTLSCLG
jgi:hypothetical protein